MPAIRKLIKDGEDDSIAIEKNPLKMANNNNRKIIK